MAYLRLNALAELNIYSPSILIRKHDVHKTAFIQGGHSGGLDRIGIQV